MRKGIKTKTGDTLIEVMIAIGIFSLVAISVVAVMNSGTSNIQTALETTMARNEIDAQAEALRFIHSSYLAEQNAGTKDGKYAALWNNVTNLANDANENIVQYSPSSCDALYDNSEFNSIYSQKAFIIDTKKLNTDAAIIPANSENDIFQAAPLYPRIYDEGLSLTDESNKFTPEGIWIVGAKVGNSPHYDFYIRTCWYGAGARVPSTISTIIRLYDPAAAI